MGTKKLCAVPVTEQDMKAQLKDANNLVNSASWLVRPEVDKKDPAGYQKANEMKEAQTQIKASIVAMDPLDDLLSEVRLSVLRSIRESFQVARHIAAADYSSRVGIPQSKDTVSLTTAQNTEINEKRQTAAAIALFVMSRYLIWSLRGLAEDNSYVKSINIQVDEMSFTGIVPAMRCATFHLGKTIEREAMGDESRLVAVVYRYAEILQQKIVDMSPSLKHTDAFREIVYQIEGKDFIVSGFDVVPFVNSSAEVREVYPDEIIGNTLPVSEIEISMRKLFLYDIGTQMNPIKEFGGFQSVQLFSGDPGNGKSLILSMARTIGRDYAEASGLPYRDLVVPNMVSKMQGESSDLAKSYLRQLVDPSTINLGIGDEFESVMPDHGGENISEGDKKVAVEFLKVLSGVSSIERLNYLFLAATNYPENIDKAFMSRVKSRYYVTGAETMDDYIRFIIVNLQKLHKVYPGIVDLKGADWNMDIRAPRVQNSENVFVSPIMTVNEIKQESLRRYEPDDIRFFALFFWMMKQRHKTFCLRDCANALDGAKSEIAKFEVPKEWITERRHYIDQPIEQKTGLIGDQAQNHVSSCGIDFASMLFEKSVYYAEEALRMTETKLNRDVELRSESMLVNFLAEKKFHEKIGV